MAQQVPHRAGWQRPLPNGGPSNARPDDALVNDWHVVAFSKDIAEGALLAAQLLVTRREQRRIEELPLS